jgi:hypothetical protein
MRGRPDRWGVRELANENKASDQNAKKMNLDSSQQAARIKAALFPLVP